MKRFGLTEKEAEEKIAEAFRKRRESYIQLKETDKFRWDAIRPFNKEHWNAKGYSEEDAILKANEVGEHNRQQWQKAIKEKPEKYIK